MSGEASKIWYYLDTFMKFIDTSIKYIEEKEWEHITEQILNEMIPVLTAGEALYSNRTYVLFNILGSITQSPTRDLHKRVSATKRLFEFIRSMFEAASNLYQFRLWHRCTLSYINKFGKPIQSEIGELFYFVQEMFVARVAPNYTIEMSNTDSIWDLQVYDTDTEKRKWLLQLRKLICEVYTDTARRLDLTNHSKLFQISLPVLVSWLNVNGDPFTHCEASSDDLFKWTSALGIALNNYDPSILECFGNILYPLITKVSKYFEGKEDVKSYAYIEASGICDNFLRVISQIITLDSYTLFVVRDGSVFISDLLNFLYDIIHKPISIKCKESAVNIILMLLKDLSRYEDDVEIMKKKDITGLYENKSIENSGKLKFVISSLFWYRWVWWHLTNPQWSHYFSD